MLFRDVCRIDEAGSEELRRLRFVAGNPGGFTKVFKLPGICIWHLRGDAIYLLEGLVDAEAVIFVESLEMPG